MVEKLCVFCKHLTMELADDYYGYCGYNDLDCGKGHNLNTSNYETRSKTEHVYDIEDFRKAILAAKDCPDYEIASD